MARVHANTIDALPAFRQRFDDSSRSSSSSSDLSLESESDAEFEPKVVVQRPSPYVSTPKPCAFVPSQPAVFPGTATTLDALPTLQSCTMDALPSMTTKKMGLNPVRRAVNQDDLDVKQRGPAGRDRRMKFLSMGSQPLSDVRAPTSFSQLACGPTYVPATREFRVSHQKVDSLAAPSHNNVARAPPYGSVTSHSRPASATATHQMGQHVPVQPIAPSQVTQQMPKTHPRTYVQSRPTSAVSVPQGPSNLRPQSSFARRVRVEAKPAPDPVGKIEFVPSLTFLNSVSSPHISSNEYSKAIVDEVKRVLIADHCLIYFVDQLRERLCLTSDERIYSISFNDAFAGSVARNGTPKLIAKVQQSNWTESASELRSSEHIESLVYIPIRHVVDQNSTIGVIEAGRKRANGVSNFSDDVVRLCEGVATLLGDSFSRHRWGVLESCSSSCDAEVSSLVSQVTSTNPAVLQKKTNESKSGGYEQREMGNERWPGCVREHDVVGLHKVRSLSFNALECSPADLVGLVEPIMLHTGCKDKFGVASDRLRNWAQEAKGLYRQNPFHNWYHGFSCFQMCYFHLFGATLSKCVSSLDTFALLIAALCHDLDHPGFTNAFLIDSCSELALRYNDNSVLENHHASLACGLLRRDATAIVSNMHNADQVLLRKKVIRSILDTDMTHHKELCDKIQAGKSALDDSQLMMSMCIHASDLSAQALPWDVAQQWESRISAEFSHQASEEIAAGRTPPPFMNFDMDDIQQRGKLQRDFCDFVLFPLWDSLSQVVPEMRPAYRNLVNNRSFYHQRAVDGKESHVEKKRRSVF